MHRVLAVLSLLLATFLPIANALADSSDGPRTVLRIRGGGALRTDGRDEVAWMAGGAIGYALRSNVLVSLNVDHFHMTSFGSSLHPVLVQFEFGKQTGFFAPRLDLGGGVYVRQVPAFDQRALPASGNLRNTFEGPRSPGDRRYPFGIMFGGGLSASVYKHTRLDLDFHYHETMASQAFGTASLGLSYGL